MVRSLIKIFLIAALMITASQAKRKSKEPPIDHMALAAMMIYDGSFDKAHAELDLVDLEKKNLDIAKYYSMRGIVSMKRQKYQEAIPYFDQAIEKTKVKVYEEPKEAKEKFTLYKYAKQKLGVEQKKEQQKKPFDPEKLRSEQIGKLQLYKSEAYYKLKDFANTIKTLDEAGEAGRNSAKLFTLRADCYWKLKAYGSAFEALNMGYEKFPKDKTLLKQKFYYFADLGMYQHALDISNKYLESTTPNAKDYNTFAQVLARSGQIDQAIKVLEEAKLRFPKDSKNSVMLGHLYLKKDMRHTTADLFEKGSYYDHNYTHEAAEMYRRANDLPHSLYLNSQINDNVEKIKQKIAIYVQREEFSRVISMKNALYRYNMLEDENLRYALAYAYFMSKDYAKAEFHLKKLTSSELFSKATNIRKNIEKCKNNSLECL